MIRVTHLISGLATGGTELMLHKVLRGIQGQGIDSAVVSLTCGGPVAEMIRALGIPVHSLNMSRGIPDPLAAVRLLRMLRIERPHVLQTWLYHADLLGLLVGKLAGVPSIAWNIRCSTMDERYERGLTGLTLRLLARLSGIPDAVVTNSHAGLALHEGIGYRPKRWALIPNGFDLERFAPDRGAYASVREELGLATDTVLIGLIARYDPVKDHATFLRAAAALGGSYPQTHFLLAGHGVDKSNAALASLLRELGLGPQVHMLGERKDVPRLTAALDIATCSSLGEGFPNIVGEAMACAVPVASTDVGDAARIIGDTGRVAPPATPSALAGAWAELLGMGQEARRSLGARARRRVSEHYDLRGVAGQYVALYNEMAARTAA
ncbi:MAG: glycosyltransferase [Actinobacteria bacterium]|nr:glycosyltransferase [Actinomycetota bacterium]